MSPHEHVPVEALAQQNLPLHAVARPWSSKVFSRHWQPLAIAAQVTVRHVQSSAGPGQLVGAQQRRFGWATVVHATLFGCALTLHLHASTEVAYAGVHFVRLEGDALAQTSRHSFATQVESSRCTPSLSLAFPRRAQLAPCWAEQLSRSLMIPPHDASSQHASTEALHRAATHVPHDVSRPANPQ